MGSSFRIPLPGRFNNKFAVHHGFLEEAINGPLHLIVTIVKREFVGPSANPSKGRVAPPGDIFTVVMEGFLEVNVFWRKSEGTGSKKAVLFFTVECQLESLIKSTTTEPRVPRIAVTGAY